MSSSPAGVFSFILLRTLRNKVRTRFRRLKEPRYLIGFLFALAYFGFLFSRPGRARRGAAPVAELFPPSFLEVELLALSSVLFALFCLAWLFRGARSALPLTEGEVHVLFPAPLTRRSILLFALLRPQLALLFSSLVFTFFLGRGGRSGSGMVLMFLGGWIALTTIQLHLQAMGFWKASLPERSPWVRIAATAGALVLPLLGLAALVRWLWQATVAFPGLEGSGNVLGTLAAVWKGMIPWRNLFVPRFVLFPFQKLLAPAFAPDAVRFLLALPGALAIAGLHYFWALSSTTSYEEATLASAQERARRRAARAAGRSESVPSLPRRRTVPFRLFASGRPEVAIVWKNLISLGRFRLGALLGLLAFLPLATFGAALLSNAAPFDLRHGLALAAVIVPTVAGVVAPNVAFAGRYDLRRDLVQAELLKPWPLDPVRLVTAELTVPWGVTLVALSTGFLAGLGIEAGLALSGPVSDLVVPLPHFAMIGAVALLLAPPFVGLILVLQNAATVAFPAWFPAGEQKAVGLEQTGVRLVGVFGTLLVLGVAAIPSLLLGGGIVWLGREALGLGVWPVVAAAASLPMWGEVWAGLHLLGSLFRRFDPALDLPPA